MEHKGKPLLLFFVMDNGPVVPEELRQTIFEPSFAWNPNAPERTGRSLFKVREFAVAHAGSVWMESKTGKARTVFLRVRPDRARGFSIACAWRWRASGIRFAQPLAIVLCRSAATLRPRSRSPIPPSRPHPHPQIRELR